jgi:hypothetical protein
MRSESESLSFLACPNLNGYTGRSQATAMSELDKTYLNGYTGRSQAIAMSELDKTFPLLILPVLPGLHNPGVWTVRVQIE